LGRQKSYKLEGQAKEVKKLNALIYYHKKANHPEKVVELMTKLKDLQQGLVTVKPEVVVENPISESTSVITSRQRAFMGKLKDVPEKLKNLTDEEVGEFWREELDIADGFILPEQSKYQLIDGFISKPSQGQ